MSKSKGFFLVRRSKMDEAIKASEERLNRNFALRVRNLLFVLCEATGKSMDEIRAAIAEAVAKATNRVQAAEIKVAELEAALLEAEKELEYAQAGLEDVESAAAEIS